MLERDPDTGDYAVWCPELPGCASAGETEEVAAANIQEAIALYALHVACAVAAECDAFLTTDRGILRRRDEVAELAVVDPPTFVRERLP